MTTGQRIIRLILDLFGLIYISIERFIEYPNDGEVLGVDIDGLLIVRSMNTLEYHLEYQFNQWVSQQML